MIQQNLDTQNSQFELSFSKSITSKHIESYKHAIKTIVDDEQMWMGQWHDLKLDLTHVDMIDSLGLNILFSFVKRAKERKANITCYVKNALIHETLLAIRMDQQMEIVEA